MADESAISITTLGSKSSSLSSSSIIAVANGVSRVRIDSSSLNRLSACSNESRSFIKSKIYIPDILTLEERRAYLVVLLNKFLLSGSSIRPVIPLLVLESLNADSETLSFVDLEVTEAENVLLEKSSIVLDSIAAILDHKLSALSIITTAAAALSCEAEKADVSVFNTIDSDASKDEVAVASDMRVLLNGSKSVGNVVSATVLKIPKIHGVLRDIVRSVHSRTRVELNVGVKCVCGGLGGDGSVEVWVTVMSPLVFVLGYLGQSSLCRVKLNLSSINNNAVQSYLRESLERSCPSFDGFMSKVGLISGLLLQEDYVMILHQVNMLLGMVKVILDWEVITAFMSLEGSKLFKEDHGSGGSFIENRINVNSDKKSEKKKKVLGKGTAIIVEMFKEKMQSAAGEGTAGLDILEKYIIDISSLLDPKKSQFDEILDKVKDIVSCNESRRLPKLPKGTRDFAKEQMTIREKAFSIIVEVFKRHGATALDTPAFELKETLMGKYGEDSKLVYDLADQGGELCSLRYDLTVPFARYVAMNGITSFKRYQIAKVYRRDNPSKGRYREFYQCDFDIAGPYERMGPDFEVIKILTELLDELDIGNYEVKLNHRQLLDGMLELCGVPPEKFRTICSSIDKLDKIPFEHIQNEMVEEKGLTVETTEKIGSFVKEKGSPLQLLLKLKQKGSKFLDHNKSQLALNDLEILFKSLERSKCLGKVVFDLSLARGLDYYTGVIFEVLFKGTTQVGSIAAGGRYDNLIGMFGTKQVPAVGMSLGIERVFSIMEQVQKDRNQVVRASETQVLVSILGDDLSLGAEVASEVWSGKLKAEFMVNKRAMKHIERAKECKIPWMVIVGEREVNEGIVKLKDIEANREETFPRTQLVQELQRRLDQKSD